MLKFSGFFLFLFVLAACTQHAADKPQLDKSRMAAVLTDLTLMEASASIYATNGKPLETDTTLRFNIFSEHNITRAAYDSSLSYYSAHPAEFKEVYDLVLENLNQLKSK